MQFEESIVLEVDAVLIIGEALVKKFRFQMVLVACLRWKWFKLDPK